jgi:hypothetical protein
MAVAVIMSEADAKQLADGGEPTEAVRLAAQDALGYGLSQAEKPEDRAG